VANPLGFSKNIIDNTLKCQFHFPAGFQKKGGLNETLIPRDSLLLEKPPPTPQNLLISASLFDDLEFHTISPPFLA
jgi:hypothetical protein